jgi:hypothetical protein
MSAADYLLDSKTVLLAREDPGRPFHYKSVEVLKGPAPAGAIDLFLDSTTRRILSTHPDYSIVLVSDDDNEWRRIGTADDLFNPLLRTILESAPAWEKTPEQRTAYFGAFLDHNNPQLRALAHLEVAKAPYDQIRTLGNAVPRERIRTFLNDIKYAEWHALYILLLAQSEDVRDLDYIEKSFQAAQRFALTRKLGAWTTALIEIQEENAIEVIERHYFQNPDSSPEELAELVTALSIHGNSGHTHLRDRIISSYDTLLTLHPKMAPVIINDLRAWKRHDLDNTLSRIASAKPPPLDFQATLNLRSYLKSANRK